VPFIDLAARRARRLAGAVLLAGVGACSVPPPVPPKPQPVPAPTTPTAPAPAPSATPATPAPPATAAPSTLPVPLPPPRAAGNWDEFRLQAAQRLVQAQPAAAYLGAVPEPLLAAQMHDIEASHCGALDTAAARRMALAQVARDQYMARMLQRYADRGIVLLAGNGHVRADIGVPQWLDAATRARSESIGLVEQGDDDDGRYDLRLVTPRQPRVDPCAGMRR